MKSKITFLWVLLLALLMTGCTPSPSSVCEKFSSAMAQGKVEEAKKYCTENTAKLIDLSASLGAVKINPNYKIEILGDSIVDNIAYVYYRENGSSRKQSMTLYKLDGEWKVNMDGKK